MKLLFVHDHIFKRSGGLVWSTQLPYHILSRYLEVFDEVTVFARCEDVDAAEGLSIASGPNVQFVFAQSVSNIKSFFGGRRAAMAALTTLVADHQAIVVRLPSEFGLLAAGAATAAGKDYAVEVVGCAWDALWNYGGIRSKLYAPALFIRTRRIVARASFATYVTRRYLQSRYPARQAAVVEAISDVQIGGVRQRGDAGLQFASDKGGRPRLGTIGSLKTRYKGVHTAIEALAHLKRQGVVAEYRVLGGGDSRQYVALAERCGVSDQVVFEGVLPPGQPVLDWLDSLDIYVQPSLTEGLPRALVEALSRGCPAVASNVGGMPELLNPEMMFRPQNSHELARLLQRLLMDGELRTKESMANASMASKFIANDLDTKRRGYLRTIRNQALQRSISE